MTERTTPKGLPCEFLAQLHRMYPYGKYDTHKLQLLRNFYDTMDRVYEKGLYSPDYKGVHKLTKLT